MKTAQLQVRLSPEQKARIRARAARAGMDLSSFVLSRVLPDGARRFEFVLDTLREGAVPDSHALAELSDLLAGAAAGELEVAVEIADLEGLSPLQANLVTAMVEHAAQATGRRAPDWCARVPPLEQPWFAAPLARLRPYLLAASPVAFRRRNLFVDSTAADRA